MSGEKYKKCCQGKIQWEDLLSNRAVDPVRYLSLRGKNLVFLNTIVEALQLDSITPPIEWSKIKKACTPRVVKKIYESIPEIWPDGTDLYRIFNLEKCETSGLYTGTYEPGILLRGITRHCLYSDSIILVDPFMDPRTIRPRYNPVENPQSHRATTLRFIWLWIALAPWIEAGLIKFVRTPGDFDFKLSMSCMQKEEDKFNNNPEFARILSEEIANFDRSSQKKDFSEYFLLLHPDEYLKDFYFEANPGKSEKDLNLFLEYIKQKREQHPYYVESTDGKSCSEFHAWTTGTNYEMAKITSSLMGSHLITDLRSRWKEIEFDREALKVNDSPWSAFSKSFHGLDFKFLDNVPLDVALKLRKENKLEDLRSFFRRIWKTSATENEMDEKNTQYLADEMNHHIREANSEWEKIDRDLFKWFGLECAGAVATGHHAIASGTAEFYGAGLAIAAITNLAVSWHKRKDFFKLYPASFFLFLKK
jgi:hypothetical protein